MTGRARTAAAFDPEAQALVLQDGGASAAHVMDAAFWSDLVADRIDANHGWLVTVHAMTESPGHWEVHPEGDELLLLQSGAVDLVLETGDGERMVPLRPESPAFVMPAGTWHRIEVVAPATLLFATYGRGTQHRPR